MCFFPSTFQRLISLRLLWLHPYYLMCYVGVQKKRIISVRLEAHGANVRGRNEYPILFLFDSNSEKNIIEFRTSDIRPYPLRLHPATSPILSRNRHLHVGVGKLWLYRGPACQWLLVAVSRELNRVVGDPYAWPCVGSNKKTRTTGSSPPRAGHAWWRGCDLFDRQVDQLCLCSSTTS